MFCSLKVRCIRLWLWVWHRNTCPSHVCFRSVQLEHSGEVMNFLCIKKKCFAHLKYAVSDFDFECDPGTPAHPMRVSDQCSWSIQGMWCASWRTTLGRPRAEQSCVSMRTCPRRASARCSWRSLLTWRSLRQERPGLSASSLELRNQKSCGTSTAESSLWVGVNYVTVHS